MRRAFTLSLTMCVALTAGAFSPASATMTGSEWLSICDNPDAGMQQLCTGYMFGIVDGVVMQQAWTESKKHICLSTPVSPLRTKSIAIKYLKDNPYLLKESARILVFLALSNAYPCPGASK